MSPDEKLAAQTVVMEYLQATAAEHPTLLLDVLLSGDGQTLVHHVLSHQAAYAQRRAETLAYLIQQIQAERAAPPAAEPGPPPSPAPRRRTPTVPMPEGV